MLLAEDLLLLLTDDETGKLLVSGSEADVALGGAQLIELTLAGRVDLTVEGEGRKDRLIVRDATQKWPAIDAVHERQLRAGLEQALLTGLQPQERVAALVSLLHALRAMHKVVRPKDHGVSKRHLDRRAKEIAEGDWGSAAVRKAVDAMTAATMAAVTAATSAAVVSGSS